MKHLFLWISLIGSSALLAQQLTPANDAWKKVYRATETKVNDLVHTKLDARFDYKKSYLNGKVWITLKPHFYPTDSLRLDAKGMNINSVAIVKAGVNKGLQYKYDSLSLNIQLDKLYQKDEAYTIYIDYTAKPNEFTAASGSSAITDAKGLYFVNPLGEEKDKPTQIWTQGETEATSVWVPTIDRPNQKTTQEFRLTVPAKYVTLSNGKLAAQQSLSDGLRTDTWIMDQPHAPYLFFMGVGDFAVVKDTYKGKEVNYYVEKAYQSVARKIFGNTPEMMQFFSNKLGVEYPWIKYSQMVARDYVSGAMENTTATLHQESAQQDARELLDGNQWESTIAHELFHQWFGDLVTAESWSNLTVNESFADYSQLLWMEYKYGKDEAGYENFQEMQSYMTSGSQNKDLVRFYYRDKEDMFDQVSYQKGGRILHMLRNYVGDDAFFKSLNKYLTANQYGTGNAHKLRLAFEEVTGKDLNWFFNQWYFGSGHPRLDISYKYDAPSQTASVVLKQIQSGDKIFTLPIAIDVYNGSNRTRHSVWLNNKADSFSFKVPSKPDLINVDPDRILLADRKDAKSLAEFQHQLKFARTYLDRREAIDFAAKNLKDPAAYQMLVQTLKDTSFRIRARAIRHFGTTPLDANTISQLESIAKNDPSRVTRTEAIDALARLQFNKPYRDLFLAAAKDSSYSVAGAGLDALSLVDSVAAYAEANRQMKLTTKGRLGVAVANLIVTFGDETAFDFIAENYKNMPPSFTKIESSASFGMFLGKVTDPVKFRKGVDLIVEFRDEIPQQARAQTDIPMNEALKNIASLKDAAGDKASADYVRSKIPADKK